jgi:hypothetical protein
MPDHLSVEVTDGEQPAIVLSSLVLARERRKLQEASYYLRSIAVSLTVEGSLAANTSRDLRNSLVSISTRAGTQLILITADANALNSSLATYFSLPSTLTYRIAMRYTTTKPIVSSLDFFTAQRYETGRQTKIRFVAISRAFWV